MSERVSFLSYSPITRNDTTSVKSVSMRSTSRFNYLSREHFIFFPGRFVAERA